MGMVLGDVAAPAIAIERLDWPTYLRHLWSEDVPQGLLAGTDAAAFHAVGARLDGAIVASGIAYDHDGDCVCGNVGTLEHARGRGLRHRDHRAPRRRRAGPRLCHREAFRLMEMAERVYAVVGLRDLGRFLEFQPR